MRIRKETVQIEHVGPLKVIDYMFSHCVLFYDLVLENVNVEFDRVV